MDFDINARSVQAWIQTRAKWWAKTVADGTQGTVMTIVREGSTKGLSNDEIATKLRQFREFQTTGRAERVARTEMTAAANQGSVESFKQAGVGQIRKTGELFEVGFDKMEAPGQGSSARENVNCRCVVLPVEDEEAAKELRDQIGEAPEAPEATPDIPTAEKGVIHLTDKGDIDIGRFQPAVKRASGIRAIPVRVAENATHQTVQSLRPNVARKLIKMLGETKRRTTVVKESSRHLRIDGDIAAGVYKHRQDAVWVSDHHSFFATHHELGHQLTARAGRLNEVLGRKGAQGFVAEVEERFEMVKLGIVRPVTDYSKKNVREYIAEAFKYAITNPKKLGDTDPVMLKIMRKYFIKETPAKFVDVPGFTGPIRALLGKLMKREVLAWPST